MNTGAIKWQVPNGSVAALEKQGHPETGAHFPRGGLVVTGSGLIFVATASDRKIRAYDEDTGKVLWERALPSGSEGIPAIYEVGGREDWQSAWRPAMASWLPTWMATPRHPRPLGVRT